LQDRVLNVDCVFIVTEMTRVAYSVAQQHAVKFVTWVFVKGGGKAAQAASAELQNDDVEHTYTLRVFCLATAGEFSQHGHAGFDSRQVQLPRGLGTAHVHMLAVTIDA
jgi:hypothetical protein